MKDWSMDDGRRRKSNWNGWKRKEKQQYNIRINNVYLSVQVERIADDLAEKQGKRWNIHTNGAKWKTNKTTTLTVGYNWMISDAAEWIRNKYKILESRTVKTRFQI